MKGTDNEADMGTKDLDGPTHQRLVAETAAQANPVQTAPGRDRGQQTAEASLRRGLDGDEEEFWTFSSPDDDCDTDSIGDVGPDGCTTSEEADRRNSSGKDC